VSDASPFSESSNPAPNQPLSYKPQAGGKSNLNIFAPPPEVVASTKTTPTYSYAADSPFNNVTSPNSNVHRRRESRVNVPSSENPFSNNEPVIAPQPQQSLFQPKANIPSQESPFSTSPMAPVRNDRDAANRQSVESPFSQSNNNTNAMGQQRGPSTRIMQTPGGTQTLNVFSSNGQ
jgi:hypothetical protein